MCVCIEGPEGWVPIPFPSPYFFQIPLPSAQISFWSRLKGFKNIYPIPILTFFSHSQCLNPGPSALNPIFPGQQKANPSSHFTPSGPSVLYHLAALFSVCLLILIVPASAVIPAAAGTLFVQFLKKWKVLQIMSKLYRNDGKSSVKPISVVSFSSKVLKSDRITFIIWFSTKNKPSLHFLVIKQSFTASRERLGRAIGHWTPNMRRRGSTAMQRVLENVCQIKSTRCLVEVNWGSALI